MDKWETSTWMYHHLLNHPINVEHNFPPIFLQSAEQCTKKFKE